MVPFQEFIAGRRNTYARDWKVQPWWFMSWSLQQLGLLGPSISAPTLPNGQYVVMTNVEQAGDKILAQMAAESNQVGRIYPMKAFREKASIAMGLKRQISDSDLAILLTSLSRDKAAIVHDSQAVKFKVLGDNSTSLSTEDKTIASLRLLLTDLSGQVSVLSNMVQDLATTAQDAVGKKDRISAMAALKSKKSKESMLVQRHDMLLQIEEILHRVEQAQDQVAMVQVMKASTSVLRNLRTQTGGVEKAEEIAEDLRDEMHQVEETSSAIEAGGQSNVVDEDVVDAELEQMMRQAMFEEEEKEAQAIKRRLEEANKDKVETLQAKLVGQKIVADGDLSLKRLSLNGNGQGSEKREAALEV